MHTKPKTQNTMDEFDLPLFESIVRQLNLQIKFDYYINWEQKDEIDFAECNQKELDTIMNCIKIVQKQFLELYSKETIYYTIIACYYSIVVLEYYFNINECCETLHKKYSNDYNKIVFEIMTNDDEWASNLRRSILFKNNEI
jgi:hypothetical protein